MRKIRIHVKVRADLITRRFGTRAPGAHAGASVPDRPATDKKVLRPFPDAML